MLILPLLVTEKYIAIEVPPLTVPFAIGVQACYAAKSSSLLLILLNIPTAAINADAAYETSD